MAAIDLCHYHTSIAAMGRSYKIHIVVPAQAGTQVPQTWIPASAGMTNNRLVQKDVTKPTSETQ
ncbi:hypothetical protein [Microbulbifer taiwanensis]|uniref:Uncharacterized protein n=1 Tax=Microbulbifer taiwanensis TaxID=986746 RepID=A0ABW1YQH2_9GAMM|nr:hypothetical protein [Microbulbifer taiwanensis]